MQRIPHAPTTQRRDRPSGPAGIGATAAPAAAAALTLQRAVGNRAVTQVLARMWVPKASKQGGRGISSYKKKEGPVMSGVIAKMEHMAAGSGTMAKGDGYRIDFQGKATGPGGEKDYVNIQLQGGTESYAGVLCPNWLPLEEIRRGLEASLAAGQMMMWHPDEEADVPDEKPQPKKKQDPKGGGKKGGGGGKGGYQATAVY